MNTTCAEEIVKGAKAAFIGAEELSHPLRPRLVYNDIKSGEIVLTEIEDSLRVATSFDFSVAFITLGGLEMLLQALREAKERGVKGRILTTDYLTFNQPVALRKLLTLDFIETRVVTGEAFHTKGYSFKGKDDEYTIFIGSSNLTETALKTNKEWNLKSTSLKEGTLYSEFYSEFNKMWESATPLSEEWINRYAEEYRAKEESNKVVRLKSFTLEPNLMQRNAIEGVNRVRAEGKNKALLIAATGTGKTYLGAFDVKNYNPRRMLFIVHREQILRDTVESFLDVLGEECRSEIGILTGNEHTFDKKYTFSTIQTLSKPDILNHFKRDSFDYIIIDEVHKAGSKSYSTVISYFSPDFLLGMSATPDRSDATSSKDGIERNIYRLFDFNIAYEIRLKEALEHDLLCPFHYFGISDIAIDGKELNENSDLNALTQDERVKHIINNSEYYGFSGNRLRGLIFCSRKEETKALSLKLNECEYKSRGRRYRTIALTGEDDTLTVRNPAVERLERVEDDDLSLDFILTVDIFNEGIDIPSVNQVIMLRPTQSSIIFIQQMGRGLRKFHGKEFVVIIDFIANYKNNFMIPIALSGDNSYNKDNLRRYTCEGSKLIEGTSTVNFDAVSKERIYKTIDSAKFQLAKFLQSEYTALKNKLGHIPKIKEFDEYGAISIFNIISYSNSYYDFLVKYDSDYKVRLTEEEHIIIRYISEKLLSGKRAFELEFLKNILTDPTRSDQMGYFAEEYTREYGYTPTKQDEISTYRNLHNDFLVGGEKEKFSKCVFVEEEGGKYITANRFKSLINRNGIFYAMVKELVLYGLENYKTKYSSSHYKKTGLTLYEKYTYEDVCRILNWKNDEKAVIGGYRYNKELKQFVIFVNYDKSGSETELQYEDRYVDNETIIACSKFGAKINSDTVNHIYKLTKEDKENVLYLFVRKNKQNEANEFYFLGEVEAIGKPIPIKMKNKEGKIGPAFEVTYHIETPVRKDIYEYMTSNLK